ncbi:Coenzyme A biosynthesis bifunctional protein coaBC [sediment metagenome]|uniref:Coenzyme A biosynthesis bifunctional protein coaBC n=1 Tax=sediment metagenome TaxID=749907 RepID=D9PJ56_9ZZZZ
MGIIPAQYKDSLMGSYGIWVMSVAAISAYPLGAWLKRRAEKMNGLTVIVSAGPNQEQIPGMEEYITNPASGKQGFEIARAAAERGAKVLLITGPTYLKTPAGVARIDVRSAREMEEAVHTYIGKADIYISAAAVADFRPATIEELEGGILAVTLARNPDILEGVGKLKAKKYKDLIVVGFAAETMGKAQMIKEAQAKVARKNLDFICANKINEPGAGFGGDMNKVVFITPDTAEHFTGSKYKIGNKILNRALETRRLKRIRSAATRADEQLVAAQKTIEAKGAQHERYPPFLSFRGKTVLITAGSTREHVDPIRFVSRPSDIEFPYTVAKYALRFSARVILITGPSHVAFPQGVILIKVKSAEEMAVRIREQLSITDVFIDLAQTCALKALSTADQKLKKAQQEDLVWYFTRTTDMKSIAQEFPGIQHFSWKDLEVSSPIEYRLLEFIILFYRRAEAHTARHFKMLSVYIGLSVLPFVAITAMTMNVLPRSIAGWTAASVATIFLVVTVFVNSVRFRTSKFIQQLFAITGSLLEQGEYQIVLSNIEQLRELRPHFWGVTVKVYPVFILVLSEALMKTGDWLEAKKVLEYGMDIIARAAEKAAAKDELKNLLWYSEEILDAMEQTMQTPKVRFEILISEFKKYAIGHVIFMKFYLQEVKEAILEGKTDDPRVLLGQKIDSSFNKLLADLDGEYGNGGYVIGEN